MEKAEVLVPDPNRRTAATHLAPLHPEMTYAWILMFGRHLKMIRLAYQMRTGAVEQHCASVMLEPCPVLFVAGIRHQVVTVLAVSCV